MFKLEETPGTLAISSSKHTFALSGPAEHEQNPTPPSRGHRGLTQWLNRAVSPSLCPPVHIEDLQLFTSLHTLTYE